MPYYPPASSSSPPFTDTNTLIKGSSDATKLLRFEVDGFTTGTTRVLTPPNQDTTIAGLSVAQTFTASQTITLGSDSILFEDVTGASSSDIGIMFSAGASYKGGMLTEVDGTILSYGINITQIGSRDTTKDGAIFRMDTRTGASPFYVLVQQSGGSTEVPVVQITRLGEMGLGAGHLQAASFSAYFHLKPGGNTKALMRAQLSDSGTSNNLLELANSTRNIITIDGEGKTTIAPYAASVGGTATNTILTMYNAPNGTPGTGSGIAVKFDLDSSTFTRRDAGRLIFQWATATDASRKGRFIGSVYDTAEREFIRGEASGTAPMIGFYGTAAVAQQTVTGSRGGNAALADLLTKLATLGLIVDGSSA